ncbi:MAG: sugar transferase [Caldilineales bacterium]|nr:sugar transferase [Caldilineales bacterium]
MSLHRDNLWTGSRRRRQLFLLLGDMVLVVLTGILAVFIRRLLLLDMPFGMARNFPVPSGVWALAITYFLALYIFDQYNLTRDISKRTEAAMLALASVVGISLDTTLAFFFPTLALGRFVVLIQLPLAIAALYAWRRLFYARLLRFAQPHRVLLVITNPVERGIEIELRDRPLGDYTVVGVFSVSDQAQPESLVLSDENGRRLEQVVTEQSVDTLVFSARGGFPAQYLEQAIDWKFNGIGVYDAANFYGAMTGRVPIETIDARWILDHLSQPYGSAIGWRMKRLLDVVLASIGLLLSIIFWPILILAIKLDSPGPAIFRQERLGLRQKPVVIAKFRSMYQTFEEEGEAAYAQHDDPRVTRVGKWLRKTRLDELPQFWNVLMGEMSIVGLRPIRQINAERLAEQIPFYHLRFSMKPGLTGWPQIRYKYADDDTSHLHKFEYELYHIQNASLAFDLYLIVKTIQQLFFGRGQ